ncbi:hypothetical protein, partial [Frankia sp. CiP1_Cm_nod2]|uniref:hypothetical protein n=1 Tax=Frankia sp. CiP1_Cm_nod2 TaxID=2897161 RepID=UPI002024C22A
MAAENPDSASSGEPGLGSVESADGGSSSAETGSEVAAGTPHGGKGDERAADSSPPASERGAGEAADTSNPDDSGPTPEDAEEEFARPSDIEEAASNFHGPVPPGGPGAFAGPGSGRFYNDFRGATITANSVLLASTGYDVGDEVPTGPRRGGRARDTESRPDGVGAGAGRFGTDGDGRSGYGSGKRDAQASGERQARLAGRWAHIPTDVVTWTATAFAAPACFEPALERLQRLHLAMVCARPGFGRPSLGLAMLSRCVVREKIFRIDAQTDPRTLDIEQLPENAGFLIENLDYRLLLSGSVRLDRLAEDFASRGSYLVITGRESPNLVDVGRYVIDVGRPASAEAIMSVQYGWFQENPDGWSIQTTGPAEASSVDPLADSAVEKMLHEVVREGQHAAVITELARRVAYARTVPDGLDAVQSWVDGHVAEGFTDWISKISTPELIAFVITLAILNGLPYRVVARVARSFEQDLRALRAKLGAETESVSDERHMLGPGRGALIEAADAEIIDSLEDSGYGLAPVEAVRFRKDGYQRRVLDWFWREHVDCHELISGLVRRLANDPRPAVRVRAGAAAG